MCFVYPSKPSKEYRAAMGNQAIISCLNLITPHKYVMHTELCGHQINTYIYLQSLIHSDNFKNLGRHTTIVLKGSRKLASYCLIFISKLYGTHL